MKLNRKAIIIGGFVLFDCIFGGLVVGSRTLKETSANSITTVKSSANNVVVDNLTTVDDDITTILEQEMISQEDLLIAEEIMMNEQQTAQDEEVRVQNQIKQQQLEKQKQLAEQKAKEEEQRKQAIAASNKALELKMVQEAAKKPVDKTIIEKGNAIAKYALQFNGNPYVFGGTSLTKGADCSGFTQSVYKQFGINLNRVARDQATQGYEVSLKDIIPGDLVFYSDGGNSVTHVAIYIGNGKIIHARTPAHGIGINSMFIMKRLHIRRVIK